MMAQPMKILTLHYPLIQVLIMTYTSHVLNMWLIIAVIHTTYTVVKFLGLKFLGLKFLGFNFTVVQWSIMSSHLSHLSLLFKYMIFHVFTCIQVFFCKSWERIIISPGSSYKGIPPVCQWRQRRWESWRTQR